MVVGPYLPKNGMCLSTTPKTNPVKAMMYHIACSQVKPALCRPGSKSEATMCEKVQNSRYSQRLKQYDDERDLPEILPKNQFSTPGNRACHFGIGIKAPNFRRG